ncbi:amino acid transporter, partial [Francisella tularensis subsp. holarctica]|nr:amino acid transporter [Francisella tularensis subsp. holarctica]
QSIRNYFVYDIVFISTVAIGALAPLLVYLVWVVAKLGTVSLYGNNGFIALSKAGENLAEAYQGLGKNGTLVFIRLF